jgi:hypothetical protein
MIKGNETMPLDDNDKKWLEQLLDRKIEDLKTEQMSAQRAQERRKPQANGNIPSAIANLDLLIEELTERVRKLEG